MNRNDFIKKLTDNKYIPHLFYAFLFISIYSAVIFGKQILYWRDMTFVYLPTQTHFARRLLAGEFPEWYPFDGLGSAYFANAFTGIAHPSFLFQLFLPGTVAIGVAVALSHAFAASGAYMLAKRWGCAPLSAFVAGAVYSLSGYLFSMEGGNLPYVTAAASIPWAVLGIEALNVPLCALSMALIAVSGERCHSLLFTSIFLAACALSNPNRKKSLACLGMSGITALLVSSFQIVPALSAGTITDDAQSLRSALDWSLNPLRILHFLTPGFLRDPATGYAPVHLFNQTAFGSFWADSLFIGAAALALGAIAVRSQNNRRRERRLLLLAAAISFVSSLGTGQNVPLFSLMQKAIPGFFLLRYPEKNLIFVVFSLSVLTAFGADDLLRDKTGTSARRFRIICLAALLLLGVTACALPSFENLVLVLAGPEGSLDDAASELKSIMPVMQRDLLSGALLASIPFLLSLFFRPNRSQRTGVLVSAAIVLPALLSYGFSQDHFRLNSDCVNSAPRSLRDGKRAFPDLSYGKSRISISDDMLGSEIPELPSDCDFIGELKNSSAALFDTETIPGYFPITTRQENKVKQLIGTDAFLAAFNGRYVHAVELDNPLTFEDIFRFKQVDGVGDRIRLVRGIPVTSSEDAIDIAKKLGKGCASTIPVTVEAGELDSYPKGGPSTDSLTISQYSPERISVTASSASDCTLFIADSFSPGWTATIDGEDAPIHRGLVLGRALRFPQGTHTVTLEYKTPGLRLGLLLSALGIALLIAATVIQSKSRSRRSLLPGPPDQPPAPSESAG